jgi:hypothetical protein
MNGKLPDSSSSFGANRPLDGHIKGNARRGVSKEYPFKAESERAMTVEAWGNNIDAPLILINDGA